MFLRKDPLPRKTPSQNDTLVPIELRRCSLCWSLFSTGPTVNAVLLSLPWCSAAACRAIADATRSKLAAACLTWPSCRYTEPTQ